MSNDALALFAVTIMLLPLACFFLSSPAFLLVPLHVPEVTQLLRALFSGYFLVVALAAAVATAAFAVAGRPALALGVALIAAFAFGARRWFLRRIDAELQARDAGNGDAVRQLRRLHRHGMLVNLVELAAVASIVPLIT